MQSNKVKYASSQNNESPLNKKIQKLFDLVFDEDDFQEETENSSFSANNAEKEVLSNDTLSVDEPSLKEFELNFSPSKSSDEDTNSLIVNEGETKDQTDTLEDMTSSSSMEPLEFTMAESDLKEKGEDGEKQGDQAEQDNLKTTVIDIGKLKEELAQINHSQSIDPLDIKFSAAGELDDEKAPAVIDDDLAFAITDSAPDKQSEITINEEAKEIPTGKSEEDKTDTLTDTRSSEKSGTKTNTKSLKKQIEEKDKMTSSKKGDENQTFTTLGVSQEVNIEELAFVQNQDEFANNNKVVQLDIKEASLSLTDTGDEVPSLKEEPDLQKQGEIQLNVDFNANDDFGLEGNSGELIQDNTASDANIDIDIDKEGIPDDPPEFQMKEKKGEVPSHTGTFEFNKPNAGTLSVEVLEDELENEEEILDDIPQDEMQTFEEFNAGHDDKKPSLDIESLPEPEVLVSDEATAEINISMLNNSGISKSSKSHKKVKEGSEKRKEKENDIDDDDKTKSLSELNRESQDYMAYHENELVKLSAIIRNLRKDREQLLKKIDHLEDEKDKLQYSNLSFKAELDEVKIELGLFKKRHGEELENAKYQLKLSQNKREILEEQNKNYQQEFERLSQKVKVDFRKIRSREKELEGQLDLIKSDAQIQVSGRDQKILELKRQIDSMEFDMENMLLHDQKAKENQRAIEEKLERVMKTLRSGINLLETEDFELENKDVFKKIKI